MTSEDSRESTDGVDSRASGGNEFRKEDILMEFSNSFLRASQIR